MQPPSQQPPQIPYQQPQYPYAAQPAWPGAQPPPYPMGPPRSLRTGWIVGGEVALVLGVLLLIIGPSPEMSCTVINAMGGQCGVLFGVQFVDDAHKLVPFILDGIGIILAAVGIALALLGARRREGAGPRGPA